MIYIYHINLYKMARRGDDSDGALRKQVAEQNKIIVEQNTDFIPRTYQIYCHDIGVHNIGQNHIEIISSNTNNAITYYKHLNPTDRIAVLNFANSHHPGGGYTHGAPAQEEELCRTSGFLYGSLNRAKHNGFYNDWQDNWDVKLLYTPNTIFIRSDGDSASPYELLGGNHQYYADIITAAAPNLSYANAILPDPSRYIKLIKNIYYAPINVRKQTKSNDVVDILILGALGCGAFAPIPGQIRNLDTEYNTFVAEMFIRALKEVSGHYKKIVFAIPRGKNLFAFADIFSRHGKSFGSLNMII
jgi:uncharacterized protein (TIGR02452 family)